MWVIIKNKMNPSEYYEFENRAYVNPTLSRDEQLGFVDNLRDTVRKDTAQINTQTQRLGKDIPSNLGGLTGSGSYFAQRYQTTPLQSQVSTLKAAAQSKALNDLLSNYQSQAANRYNQAYRAYNKRTNANNNSTTDAITKWLKTLTNPGSTSEVDYVEAKYGVPHKIETDDAGNLYYVYENFASPVYGYNRLPIAQASDKNDLAKLPTENLKNGATITVNGNKYIYLSTGQDKDGWYKISGNAQLVPGTGE